MDYCSHCESNENYICSQGENHEHLINIRSCKVQLYFYLFKDQFNDEQPQ